MKYFKKIENKIKDLGFDLVYQSDKVIQYERYNNQFKYTQGVELIRKTGRIPIIQSYQKDSGLTNGFDYMVGLNVLEIKLFLKLIKKLKWI